MNRKRIRCSMVNDVMQRNVLPDVIRNEIGARYITFGCREVVGNMIAHLVCGERTPPCPIAGRYSESQNRKRQRSLEEKPVTQRRVINYLEKRLEGDQYPMGGRQLDHFRSIIQQCKDNDVTLIVYELPQPMIMEESYPQGTTREFIRMVRDMTREADVPFVRYESELGLTFTDADFREQSHMNNDGALRLTEALGAQVLTRFLRKKNREQ